MTKTNWLPFLNLALAITTVILGVRFGYWLHNAHQPVFWLDPIIPVTSLAFVGVVIAEVKLRASTAVITKLLNVVMVVSFLVIGSRTAFWEYNHMRVPTFFDVIAPVSGIALVAAFITKTRMQRTKRIQLTGDTTRKPVDVAATTLATVSIVYIGVGVLLFLVLVIAFSLTPR